MKNLHGQQSGLLVQSQITCYIEPFLLTVMAEGGSNNDNIDKLSKRLESVHLDLMDEEDN